MAGLDKRKVRKVFVVHGRDVKLRKAMSSFLRSIGLKPLVWSDILRGTGRTTPHVSEILNEAFDKVQAVLVLMTPDEIASLKYENRARNNDPQCSPESQPRPNVFFEAGMAMANMPDRTVLVKIGDMRGFSDINGLVALELDGSTEKRQELADLLESAGCKVNRSGTDWHTEGDFPAPMSPRDSTTPTSLEVSVSEPPPESFPESKVDPVSPDLPYDLVVVEPGTVMVFDPDSGEDVELTVEHRFAIGRFPVTQKFYREVLEKDPSRFHGDDLPVEQVTWHDAYEFCAALSRREDLVPVSPDEVGPEARGYRLPTEAEWVFACAGGTTGQGFPTQPRQSAWYKDNSRMTTHPVGELKANGLKIYDMLGNVEEWCQDSYYPRFVPTGPQGKSVPGGHRVCRGGSWNGVSKDVSMTARNKLFPTRRNQFTGFRLALTIPKPEGEHTT